MMGSRVCTPELGRRLNTYKMVQSGSVVSTPVPILCATVASPGLKLKGRVCVEWMLLCSQTGEAYIAFSITIICS